MSPQRWLRAALAIVLLLACAECLHPSSSRTSSAYNGPWIRRAGTQFFVGHRPFRFVGANAAVMHSAVSRHSAERLLDALVEDGITVIRIWGFGESNGTEAWRRDYGFRLGNEAWVEESFEHLDRVLVAAKARGLRVIVVLANRWADFGGIPQYLRWGHIYPTRRDTVAAELLAFFEQREISDRYTEHVRRVVGRTNSISGTRYRDDPTILAWELFNEASAPSCAAAEAFVDFVDREARWIHMVDPHHLVGAGHIGYNSARSRNTWERVHALESIDYVDHHLYFTYNNAVVDARSAARWMDDRIHLAHDVLQKPLVFGEVGFSGADERFGTRAQAFDMVLRHLERRGVSGALAWIYQGPEEGASRHAIQPWGPLRESSTSVRAVLSSHARRWAAVPRVPALQVATRDGELDDESPLMVQSEWQQEGRILRMHIDPTVFEEADECGTPGTISYPIQLPTEPAARMGWSLTWDGREFAVAASLAGSTHAPIELGVSTRDNGPQWSSHALGGGRRIAWLRLRAINQGGQALLTELATQMSPRANLDLTWILNPVTPDE